MGIKDYPSPTFALPCCPKCSTGKVVGGLERPVWKYAHNTSAKRKRNCYFWVGCGHAQALAQASAIFDEPAAWEPIEAAWRVVADALFAEKTAAWPERERHLFRMVLDDKSSLPGATETFSFTPACPASTATTESDNDHGS